MAKLLKKLGDIYGVNELLNRLPGTNEELASNIASKAMRAKIEIWDRRMRGFERVDVNGPRGAYKSEKPSRAYPGIKSHRDSITGGDNERSTGIMVDPDSMSTNRTPTHDYYQANPMNKDYISIIDYDYNPTSEKTSVVDDTNETKPKLSNRRYRELRIPFIPRELQMATESNFVGISSFGRNNPFYQYTGAEDTLTFEIDWLASNNNREDVITKCRWIEALTKGDGYNDVPHRIILMWGSDNKLFRDYKWLVVAAPYRLLNFTRGYMENNEFTNTSLLPNRAIQQITLKRITDTNLTSAQIIGNLDM